MKRKNNKGFTLVELLAVIVVLAIVMLVVADRVGDAMLQSRGNSFALQIKSLQREMEKVCAMNNEILVGDENIPDSVIGIIKSGNLSYVNSGTDDKGETIIYVVASSDENTKSKFANIKLTEDVKKLNGVKCGNGDVACKTSDTPVSYPLTDLTDDTVKKTWLRQPSVSFNISCPISQ